MRLCVCEEYDAQHNNLKLIAQKYTFKDLKDLEREPLREHCKGDISYTVKARTH